MEHTENKKQEFMDNNQIAMKVSAVSIVINLVLSVLKLIAGNRCAPEPWCPMRFILHRMWEAH